MTFSDESTQDITGIKHSLLMQLLRQLIHQNRVQHNYFEIPKAFKEIFDKYSHSQFPPDDEVDKTFGELLNQSRQIFYCC